MCRYLVYERFLRLDPSIYAPRNWNRLIQPSYAAEFTEVFQKYTVRYVIWKSMVNMTLPFVRTMKSSVQAELTIPAQTRYVFPIHLGKVERHVSFLFTC
jgi:E3 ubiquitin-protein ligase SHPRH